MGPARRRFHGVPRYSRGPRGSSNSVQAVGAARSRRFSWRIFFPLSFSITAPISYPSPPFWIFWRKNNIATMTQLYSRKRDKCCDEFFFFFSYDKSVLYRYYIIYFIDSSWTFSQGTIYYKWWQSIIEKINAQWRLLREIKRNFRSTNRLSEIVEPVEREFSAFWIGQRRCTRGDKVWWFVGFETPLRWKRRLDFSRACARVVSRARSSRLYAHANAHHSTKARELT